MFSYPLGFVLFLFNIGFGIALGYCLPRYKPEIKLQPAKMPRIFSPKDLGRLLYGCSANQISAFLEEHDKLKSLAEKELPYEYLDYETLDYLGHSKSSPRGKETDPVTCVAFFCIMGDAFASFDFFAEIGYSPLFSLIPAAIGLILCFITYRLTKKYRNNNWIESSSRIKIEPIIGQGYSENDIEKITDDLRKEFLRVEDIVYWRESMLRDRNSAAKFNYQIICVLTAINVVLLVANQA